MPRYKLTIEYDGSDFAGWQRQANGLSVQAVIEAAVGRLSGETITVFGAGRTDAGVHATGQVAHVDLARDWPTDTVRDALNAHLRPHPVSILAAETVPRGFDARFSAVRRHYLYRIVNRRPPVAIERKRAWHVVNALDVAAMAEGAGRLVGHHDFTTFRASHCQAKSPVKTLETLTVERDGELVLVRAAARSFLHNQVRSMVGTLVLVGQGRWTPDDVGAALAARDRKRCGPVAPPDGLYLTEVEYRPLAEIADAPPPNSRAAARLAATAAAEDADMDAGG